MNPDPQRQQTLSGDYHTHNQLCTHAVGTIDDYVASAIEKGFQFIGISDHIPLGKKDGIRMGMEELPEYFRQIAMAKEKYSDIDILTGIEADVDAGSYSTTCKVLADNDFDYVIGSVHFIELEGAEVYVGHLHLPERVIPAYRISLSRWREVARDGKVQIAAHLDLPGRQGIWFPEELIPELRETLQVFRQQDILLEINTNGIRHTRKCIYPHPVLLSIIRDSGVGIIINSDAHQPKEVGQYFSPTIDILRANGFTEATILTPERKGVRL